MPNGSMHIRYKVFYNTIYFTYMRVTLFTSLAQLVSGDPACGLESGADDICLASYKLYM